MLCQEAVHFFNTTANKQLLVTDDEELHVKGVISLDALLSNLISGTVKQTDRIEKSMIQQFTKVTTSTTLGQLSHILKKELYAVVLNDDNILMGIVNQNDVFNFVIESDNTVHSNGIM